MIAKLWKVSWSTSQCIFYVICSIEWSPTLVCTIFIHYPFSFCWETSHNIPQTNNMRQTNNKIDEIWTTWNQKPVLFTQKTNHTYLWRLFFSWQLCGQSDSFRPVEVVLNHQLLPSFIRFLSPRTPTTPSTHHFSAREAVRGDPANMPTKKEMWQMIQFLSCHIFISCYLMLFVYLFHNISTNAGSILLRSNINISQVALLPIHRPTTIQQHPPWKDDSIRFVFPKKKLLPPKQKKYLNLIFYWNSLSFVNISGNCNKVNRLKPLEHRK